MLHRKEKEKEIKRRKKKQEGKKKKKTKYEFVRKIKWKKNVVQNGELTTLIWIGLLIAAVGWSVLISQGQYIVLVYFCSIILLLPPFRFCTGSGFIF